ncbi:MAG TPA: diguanylate cyclase, partial [Candidatus Sulfotelmatobacter sp.]|nr:diguanylate cyclase [Candidatus Sulfotelmatobacter sp.]
VALIFAAREPVRGVLLKGIAGDGKLVEMTARAKPILAASGERIGARGVLNFVSAEDERRFAVERDANFDLALTDLRDLFTDVRQAQQSLQQSCARVAEILNTAGTAAYVLQPRSAEFRRIAWHGPVAEHAIDLCARPFLERLTDGRLHVEGRKYHRQILAAASRQETGLIGAFVCWREDAEDPWSAAEQEFAQNVAAMQAAALADVQRTTASISAWAGASASELAVLTSTVAAALAAPIRAGSEPCLLSVHLDNIEALSATAGRARAEELVTMLGLILRRAAEDGLVVQVAQDEFSLWLPQGGRPHAKSVIDACHRMVDPLRGKAGARTRIGLSIGAALAEPGRFIAFESMQKEARQGAVSVYQKGGHAHMFV